VINNIGHILDLEMLREAYQQLDRKKAVGVDGVTKEEYGKELSTNLKKLLEKIRSNRYQAKPSRLVSIPKEDGSTRILAIGTLEDKIVQGAVYLLLSAIYEPIFLDCSYGFRPKRSCHDALRVLNKQASQYWDGMVIDIDLKRCFDSIPHKELLAVIGKKITDSKFVKLIARILKSPIMKDGKIKVNEIGCPQGNLLSPLLANIYLHEVLDTWFEEVKTNHLKWKAALIRYCDDAVLIFQNREEARRVFRTLPKRLGKYGLSLHEDKSRLIVSGRKAAERAGKAGEKLPTYNFLGFTCYFGKSRQGVYRLKYTSRRDRFTAKLKEIKEVLKKNLNCQNTGEFLKLIVQIIRGWINYHGISDNGRRVNKFLEICRKLLFDWFNRRGRKGAMTWKKFPQIMNRVNFPRGWKTVSMFT